MTSTITRRAERRQRRGAVLPIFAVSLAMQVFLGAGLWYFEPLRKSTMTASKEELASQDAEAKQRAQELEKKEREERKERKLTQEDSKKLMLEEEEKRERKMIEKIERMRELKQEIAENKNRKLQELDQRDVKDIVADILERLRALALDIQKDSQRVYRENAQNESALANQDLSGRLLSLTDQLLANATMERDPHRQTARALDHNAEVLVAQRRSPQPNNTLRGSVASYLSLLDSMDNLNGELAEDIADPTAGEDLAQMDMEQLHNTAQELEQAIAEDYADIRAAELAMMENQSFAEASANITDLGSAANPLPEGFLQAQPETIGEMNDYRNQLDLVAQSTNAMLNNASNMAAEAAAMAGMLPNQQGAQGQMNGAARQSAANAMSAAATGQMGRYVDISGIMRAQAGMSMGGVEVLTSNTGREGLGSSALGSGGTGIRSLGEQRLDSRMIMAQALPGRKFTKQSARSGWMYLDTWYIIGPWKAEFPDGRIQYDEIHPPEVRIDLDATYRDGKPWEKGEDQGKPRELRWKFFQSNTLRTTPPDEQFNATYYCYTEVYFEEDTDMLLALGTDDGAKMWLNDQIVWQDDGLSSWSLQEGFRKVFFRKGFNRLLLRLSSGPGVCQFSVLLCPPGQEGG